MSKRIEADPLPSSSWPNSLPAHSWRIHDNGDITCLVTQATRNADKLDYAHMVQCARDKTHGCGFHHETLASFGMSADEYLALIG